MTPRSRLLTRMLLVAGGLLVARLAGAKEKEPTTRLDVVTQPTEATVFVDHKMSGATPLTLTDLAPGPHLIQVSKPTFQDVFDTITLEPGVTRSASYTLVPVTGLLLLTSTPSGCEVSANGLSLGNTPVLVTSLPSGTHRLTIASPGFQTKEIDVTLEGRTPVRQDVTLMSDSGTLDVSSVPDGAEVLINGISRGQTPCRVDRIPGGVVTLELKAEGFQPHNRELTLAAGEVQSVSVQLTPRPGTLHLVSIPDMARVYIDNEFRGDTPYDLAKLPPGTYRVRVEKAGYEPVARDITLEKGATVTEEFRLAKNTGRLELVTAPSGATILIDGKKVGITLTRKSDTTAVSDPFAVEDLQEGDHIIEAFRKGYVTQKGPVTIKRGETLTRQINLVRQFIPNYEVTTTRSYYKGVLEYKNDEGIRLETSPGVSQTIPMKDVKKHGPLQEGE